MRKDIIESQFYKGYEILVYEDGSIIGALNKNIEICHVMQNKYPNGFLFVRADLHYPKGMGCPKNNNDIRRCFKNFNRDMERRGLHSMFRWAWEREKSDAPHYHCFILVQLTTQSPACAADNYLGLLQRHWLTALGLSYQEGLVNFCKKDKYGRPQDNHIVVRPCIYGGTPESLRRAIRWASYLAKAAGKEKIPEGVNRFGGSRC